MTPEDILKQYTPVIEWSEEDQVYLASYPDLMGPFAHVHGDTPEEAMANMKECAIIHIEYELEKAADGSTIAPPRTIVSTPAPDRYFQNDADIEVLRHSFGISQADFSRVLGVSLSTYSKWARGIRRPSGSSARLLQVAREYPQALGLRNPRNCPVSVPVSPHARRAAGIVSLMSTSASAYSARPTMTGHPAYDGRWLFFPPSVKKSVTSHCRMPYNTGKVRGHLATSGTSSTSYSHDNLQEHRRRGVQISASPLCPVYMGKGLPPGQTY